MKIPGDLDRKGLLTLGIVLGLVAAFAVWNYTAQGRGKVKPALVSAWGAQPVKSKPLGLDYFSSRSIGKPLEGAPWISDLLIVDLDQDGLKDVLVCDAQLNRIGWIRQVRLGVFEEQDIGDTVAGPAHVEVADMNGDGRPDIVTTGKFGGPVWFENKGR